MNRPAANPPSRPLTLGLIQHACVDDPAANQATAVELIRDAAGRGAQLVVTQELFRGLYFPVTENPDAFDLAEPIPGPTTQRLGELARELGVWLSASLFERRAPGLYHNTSVLLGPDGRLAGMYRKAHIPDDPGFYEKYYFTPGDTGFPAHRLTTQSPDSNPPDPNPPDAPTVGMLVCWDQWFPEAARLSALHGAELLLYPTAIGWLDADDEPTRQAQADAWRTIQRSHAIANGVFVAAVNRMGHEADKTFWGGSFIADPMGRVLAQAPPDQPAALVATIDLAHIEQSRRDWNLFLRDRRIDAYAGLTQRWLGDDHGQTD